MRGQLWLSSLMSQSGEPGTRWARDAAVEAVAAADTLGRGHMKPLERARLVAEVPG